MKDRFDPNGLFNPGKIVRAPKFDDRSLFRYGPDYRADEIKTHLDWSAYPGQGGGFQGAVEMCNNNGACRALAGGVMCPSYRVTREERDVTRGRANTLRLALTGQLGPDALASDEMAETLKYCVSCKACRRECPTGVDMARMKIEVQAARLRKRRLSLHDRLVGYLPRYAPFAARHPSLFNLRDKMPALARWSEKFAGFSARRKLPAWREDWFDDRSYRRACPGDPRLPLQPPQAGQRSESGPEVVLFADTFNRYFEPENIHAAVTVLEAAGCRVHLPKPAGRIEATAVLRPHLPVGRSGRSGAGGGRAHDRRARAARRTRRAGRRARAELHPRFPRRDPGLLKTEEARWVASRAMLFEEFVTRELDTGSLPLAPIGQRALLHGHCHQKSFGAMGAVEAALKLVPGLAVETIESSCCGMAGAFGYGADTIDVSLKMGELSLLAGRAQRAGRRDHRRRRHLLPSPDRRRRGPRGVARRPRAGDERRGRAQDARPR